VPNGEIFAGDRFPFTPKHSLSVDVRYELPFDSSIGDVSVGAGYNYTSGQIASYALRQPAFINYFGRDFGILPSRNFVNAYLNWNRVADSPIDLGLFVTNLTNDKYLISISGFAEDLGFVPAGVGQPRMYGVKLRFNFGHQ
jgi:iron complex outermembrane receptor protein